MKKYFLQDKIQVGLVVCLGLEVITFVVAYIVILLAGYSPSENVRWFAVIFVPVVLALRFYAKRKEQLIVTKTLIITLFITFLAFMFFLLKTQALTL